MPKWLQQMIVPTLMLWLCVVAFAIASARSPDGLPKGADLAAAFVVPLVMASWVTADARKRGRRLCYDYDTFVFMAWPVVVPIYLFQTRGIRAILTLLCFGGILLVAILAATAVFIVRGFALR
jgi:hypothetical protein